MAHRVFISFKTEDKSYKNYIQNNLGVDMVDKSLNEAIDSDDEEYIMRKIRKEYLSDSTVTIFLIGAYSAENIGAEQQSFIKRELQASSFDGKANSKNGILGIVLPNMTKEVFGGSYNCNICGNVHQTVVINDTTVIKEFSYNYYIPNNKCAWFEEDRYCVLVGWEEFKNEPEKYIDQAFDKRSAEISKKTKVIP